MSNTRPIDRNRVAALAALPDFIVTRDHRLAVDPAAVIWSGMRIHCLTVTFGDSKQVNPLARKP